MKIYLYNLTKRENSTKLPANGTGTEFECYLKKPTSIINPGVLIDFSDQTLPAVHIFNYAYIPDFNRYYFIDDIVSDGHLWSYSLRVDILGTYKSTISASTLYLLRCSSQYDGALVDTFYPVKHSYSTNIQYELTPWIHTVAQDNIDLDEGCYILGVVDQLDPNIVQNYTPFGSVKYVALDANNLADLLTYLLDSNTLTSNNVTIDGVSNEAVKSIIDPLQFIKSCMWCPLQYLDIAPASEEITDLHIWSWTASGVKWKRPNTDPPYYVHGLQFTLPQHPKASTKGIYLNAEPYTKHTFSHPPFGAFDLDTSLTAGASQVRAQTYYDVVTGEGILEIRIDGILTHRVSSQVGVPIQLTQVYNDYINAGLNAAGSIVGGITSLLAGNVAGAISGGLSAIGSAVDAMRPVQSTVGGTGSFADLRGRAALYSVFYDIPEEDNDHVGRPLCKNVSMSGVTAGSYCLAMDGDVQIAGTASEQQDLKSMLEGGFYYE